MQIESSILKWKINILVSNYNNNGNIDINRTGYKIKASGYLWETLLDDDKEFIGNCPKYILAKNSKKTCTKIMQKIPKGSLEHVARDGWELDLDLKNLKGIW